MTEVLPWVKWRFDRWHNDEGLRICGLAARGLWIELLCVMHGGTPYGHLTIKGHAPNAKQIASLAGMTTEKEVVALLRELEDAGVFNRTDEGVIFCRRMIRDNAARIAGKATGSLGGNPVLKGFNAIPDNEEGNGQDQPPPLTEGVNPPRKPREEREKEREDTPPPPASGGERSKAVRDDPAFTAFWSAYPRKEDKGHARKAWAAAIRKAEPQAIVEAVQRHAFNPDPKFRPLAATWLNGERWDDLIAQSDAQTLPLTGANPTGRVFTPMSGGL